jgi:hypothetical protein
MRVAELDQSFAWQEKNQLAEFRGPIGTVLTTMPTC